MQREGEVSQRKDEVGVLHQEGEADPLVLEVKGCIVEVTLAIVVVERAVLRTFRKHEDSGSLKGQVLNSKLVESRCKRLQDGLDVVKEQNLVEGGLSSPARLEDDVNFINAKACNQTECSRKLKIAQVVHDKLGSVVNQRHHIERAVWLLYLGILVVGDADEADGHGDKSTEVSQESKAFRSDFDEVVGSQLKVLHLVNKGGTLADEVEDLVSVTLSADILVEVVHGALSEEVAHWVDREVDRHYLVILVHFHIASVTLEELEDVCG